jgi:hypothetical protein
MSKSKISRWERFKRVVAHLFELKTKLEIKEEIKARELEAFRIEMARFKEERLRELELEYEQPLFEYQRQQAIARIQEQKQKEEALRKQKEEEELRERVRLYRENPANTKSWSASQQTAATVDEDSVEE